MKWNWVYVLPSTCAHPWDSSTLEDEALGRKSLLKRFLNRKLNFQLWKAVFLINGWCFPQQILILPLVFFWPKSIWSWCIHAGYRRKGLLERERHTEPARILFVCAVWLASALQCRLLRGSVSHLEISRENKIEFFTKSNYISANYMN